MKKKNEIQPTAMSDAEFQEAIKNLSKKKKGNGRYALAAFLCFVACVPLSWKLPSYEVFFVVVFALKVFIVAPVLLMRGSRIQSKLNEVVAENLTRGVLQEVFEVETYSVHDHLGRDFVNKMKLIRGWNTVGGSNYVSGKYKGRGVTFSEIFLEDNDRGEGGFCSELFEGPWIILEHGQTLPSPVWVISDKDKRKWEKSVRFSLVGANSSKVNWTMTPDFVKLLEYFHKELPKSNYITFYENKICIAIDCRRRLYYFTTRDLKDINGLREEYRANTKYITDILDELIKIDSFFD